MRRVSLLPEELPRTEEWSWLPKLPPAAAEEQEIKDKQEYPAGIATEQRKRQRGDRGIDLCRLCVTGG